MLYVDIAPKTTEYMWQGHGPRWKGEVVVSQFIGSPIYLKIYPPVIHPESGAFYGWDKLQACWNNHSML